MKKINNNRTVSVIVTVTKVNIKSLQACLNALISQSLSPFEIVVVDNTSSHAIKAFVETLHGKYPQISYLIEKRLGRVVARNTGIHATKGNIIAMISEDCTASVNWLKKITDPILYHNRQIVIGKNNLKEDTSLFDNINIFKEGIFTELQDSNNLAITRDLLQKFSLDVSLGNFEILDLELRLYERVQITYVSNDTFFQSKANLLMKLRLTFDRGFWIKRIYYLHRDDLRFKNKDFFLSIDTLKFLPFIFKKSSSSFYFFLSPSKIIWYMGMVYESFRREGIFLFLSRKYYSHSIESLIDGFSNTIQQYKNPNVSIIIPLYNQVRYTIQCIESIQKNTKTPYEIILINNGSTDETEKFCKRLKNITYISNKENLGYSHANNQGAKTSSAKYLLFLNNDAVVKKEWLTHLYSSIENNPEIAAVGPKLIHFNGRLQAAGCNLTPSGWFTGRGQGDDPKRKKYGNQLDTVALYGACILIRKKQFIEVGGFDTMYSPAYHEDIDLCLKLKKRGYKLIYQPKSTVLHKEFTSSERQVRKELLEKNHILLYSKWKSLIHSYLATGKYI